VPSLSYRVQCSALTPFFARLLLFFLSAAVLQPCVLLSYPSSQQLVEKGADVDSKDSYGGTPLSWYQKTSLLVVISWAVGSHNRLQLRVLDEF
jgi:hypothetical protein